MIEFAISAKVESMTDEDQYMILRYIRTRLNSRLHILKSERRGAALN